MKQNSETATTPPGIDLFFRDLGITPEELENEDFLELERKLGIDSNQFGNINMSEERQRYVPNRKIISYDESVQAQYAWVNLNK